MRRGIWIIGAILFFILGSLLIFSIDWGGSGDQATNEVAEVSELTDLSDTDARVRMTTRGPIVGDIEHESLRFTVDSDQVVVQLLGGYEETVKERKSYANNGDSFESFLSALMNTGFTNQQSAPEGIEPIGACPNGMRYIFEIIGGGDQSAESWATSCSSKIGTFSGDLSTTRNLFENQVPRDDLREILEESSL